MKATKQMKKVLCMGLAGGLVLACLTGCGKSSEEKQAANYYQKELGLDKDEAEELAHEIYGKDEDQKEEAPSVTDAPKEIVVEPLPELVDSEWYDCKVQILDMVFNYNLCMTEEDIRKIVEGSAYDVNLTESFDSEGNICLGELRMGDERLAKLKKVNYSNSDIFTYGDYELLSNGYYYYVTDFKGSIPWYDKLSIEFENITTRDDVLAYLAENGFVEVGNEQEPYEKKHFAFVSPDDKGAEFADVPHYYCKGVQSITVYRIHKLAETDQIVDDMHSGAHVNLVNCVTFNFTTDGTISSINSRKKYESMIYGSFLGEHDVDILLIEIMGELI